LFDSDTRSRISRGNVKSDFSTSKIGAGSSVDGRAADSCDDDGKQTDDGDAEQEEEEEETDNEQAPFSGEFDGTSG
jgi:hypothetical protein